MEGREEASGDDLIVGDLAVGELSPVKTTPLRCVCDKLGHVDHGARLSAPEVCAAPGALSIY